MLLKGKRIFLIEDNLINRSIMQTLLEREGAIIEFERWGKDTEERLQKFIPVDIILLDLMFPDDVSGYDIFDRIRLLPEFIEIPIVAVSAADDTMKARAKGFAGYIKKPVDPLQFANQITNILDHKPVWIFR